MNSPTFFLDELTDLEELTEEQITEHLDKLESIHDMNNEREDV